MATSRADSLSGSTRKKTELYSDFLNSFALTPVGNQLGRVTEEQSVNQSLKNIIYTNLGERLFQPEFGSSVNASLFDPNDQVMLNFLQSNIETTIKRCEPRIYLMNVEVLSPVVLTNDRVMQENGVLINIMYSLINRTEPITLTVVLKRVR